MYRPNRIGQWSCGDVDKAIENWTQTTLAAIDQADNTYGGVVNTLATLEDYITDSWKFSNAGGVTFPADQQFGIGNAVSGLDTVDNTMYSIVGSLNVRLPANNSFEFQFMCGRLAAAPSKSASITIANPIFLPLNIQSKIDDTGVEVINANIDHIFIQQSEKDGGVLPVTFPDDYFDIFFGFRIVNGRTAVGAVTISGLSGSLSIYKYRQDLMTFDPNR